MDRSVVHFLPSFWEEVGRTFIELGNSTYAGRAFSKARDAEQVHALAVDEERLREVFLEFALAGALTVRVLSTYSKDPRKSRRPADAWALFRDLCARRTLGGLPPWKAVQTNASANAAFTVALQCLPLFAYRLPAGDPAHRAMFTVARQVSERLQHPDLLLELGENWDDEERLEQVLGATATGRSSGMTPASGFRISDQGLVLGAESGWALKLAFRPARIRGDDDRQRIRDLAAAARLPADQGGSERVREYWSEHWLRRSG